MKVDLSRPDLLFCIFWSIPLILLQFFSLDFFLAIEPTTKLLIFFNITSFFIIYFIVKKSVKKKLNPSAFVPNFDFNKLKNFFRFYFILWAVFYLVVIIYSKGFPLIWILMGSEKTYYDFGVPTLSGFLNMLRAFLSVLSVILLLKTNQKKYFFYVLFFLFSAFIIEASRGGGVVLFLHIAGYYFLTKKFKIKDFLKLSVFILLFIIFLGLIEIFRYTNNSKYNFTEKYTDMDLFDNKNNILLFTIPAILYITTPVQNLNYLILENNRPLYYPYYSSMGLVPTILRDKIFPIPKEKAYGSLLSEAYNTTSFYVPLIKDFGIFFTSIIILFFQAIVSYIHVKSKYKKIITYRLLYPPYFMCVVLSPFNLYFTSLVVVAYPIIVHLFIHHRTVRLKGRNYK